MENVFLGRLLTNMQEPVDISKMHIQTNREDLEAFERASIESGDRAQITDAANMRHIFTDLEARITEVEEVMEELRKHQDSPNGTAPESPLVRGAMQSYRALQEALRRAEKKPE